MLTIVHNNILRPAFVCDLLDNNLKNVLSSQFLPDKKILELDIARKMYIHYIPMFF